jgi:hypothetical protein
MGLRRRYYDEYHRNSKLKKHGFFLSFDYFNKLISSNCHYCGGEPEERDRWKTYSHKKQPIFKCNGIDRVDSSIGYTEENTVSCCSKCNIMKNVYSQEVFLNHITKIYLFNNELMSAKTARDLSLDLSNKKG